jgi:hypothetical protein
MVRPEIDDPYQVACAQFSPTSTTTPFPNGMALTIPVGSANPRVTLTKIIQFDPQGAVSVLGGGLVSAIEIGLQPTHGSTVPQPPANPNTGNQAAIQIDGTTGAVTIYRS